MAKRITIPITDHNTDGVCTQYYQVEYKINGEAGYSFSQMMLTTPIVLNNMLDDTLYDFRITRVCCDDVASTPAIFQIDTTPGIPVTIDAPTTFTANQVGSIAVLNWDDMPEADEYQLQRATNVGFTANLTEAYIGTVSGFTDTGLAAGTYYYRVRSIVVANPPGPWSTANITMT